MVSQKFIVRWNNTFPLDRWWRNKHKVAFNSPEHRQTRYLDIVQEFLEDRMVQTITEDSVREHERMELYKQGIWIKPDETRVKKEEDLLFDKLKLNLSEHG